MTPTNIQRLITLRKFQFPVSVAESAVSELCRLPRTLGFKSRVLRPSFKEIPERGLLVPQALLQGDAGNFIQEREFRHLLDGGQSGVCANVIDLLLRLIVSVGSVAKDAVIDKTHTPKGLSQQLFLLLVWLKPKFVGAFSFHASHSTRYSCEGRHELNLWRLNLLPMAEARGIRFRRG